MATREHSIRVGTSTGVIDISPTVIGPGTKFTISVTDADLNANPEGTESVEAGMATNPTLSADFVRLISDASGAPTLVVGMEETGPNTGVFEATVQLSPRNNAAPTLGGSDFDWTYRADPGDILSVRYTDQKNAAGNKAVVSKTFLVQSFDPTITAEASVAAGGVISLTVQDADANLDGDAQDSIRIRVTSDSDPVGMELSALETDINTGVFTLDIPTTIGVSSGSVTVKTGDSVYLKYNDKFPADFAERTKQVVDASKDFKTRKVKL